MILGNPQDKTNIEAREGKIFEINEPGEYESSGIFLYSVANPQHGECVSLLTSLTVGHTTIAHLGSLNQELEQVQFELFEGSDILIIPVGGHGVLDAKKAVALVEKIEPRIVIPMHAALSGLKTKYDDIEKFIKEIGAKTGEPQEKLKITKKDLPQETMEVVYLKP